jgi:hypothetical protein
MKKGQTVEWTWMELTVAAVAVLCLLALAYRIGSPHGMNQEYIAKDSATIIDALYGVPKDATAGITYPHRFDQCRFETKDSLVLVSSPGSSDFSEKSHYPYIPHADYVGLNENFLFVSLDFLKDRTGVHFSPTTNVQAGTLAVEDLDTAGTLQTKRIFITGKPEAKDIINLLKNMASIESEKDATEENADMIIFISTNAENILRIYYADEDILNSKKSKKLAEITYNRYLGTEGLFVSRELALPTTHLNEFSVFRNHVPTLLIEMGSGLGPAAGYAEPVVVAVREYYLP